MLNAPNMTGLQVAALCCAFGACSHGNLGL
jgi:hypothetical protein